MDLNYGGGSIDAIFDLLEGKLYPYSGHRTNSDQPTCATIAHDNLSGKQYYWSQSGRSGAGWIPDKLTTVKLETYRVDSAFVEFYGRNKDRKTIGDMRIYAPISFSGGEIPHDWPMMVFRGDEIIALHPSGYDLQQLLRGEIELETMRIEITYRTTLNEDASTRMFFVKVPERSGIRKRKIIKAIEAFFIDEIGFDRRSLGDGEGYGPESPFFNRLGLWQAASDGRRFVKLSQGICRGVYEDLRGNQEALQAASPKNVLFISPNLYVQGGLNVYGETRYEAVGEFEIEGQYFDFELVLNSEQAVAILAGSYNAREETEAILREGAERKAEIDRDNLSAQQAAKVEESRIITLCDEHGDAEVTIEDSRSAGNCKLGSESFRDQHFPGRESVSIRELVPYLNNFSVRRVVVKKLRDIGAI